MWRGIHIKLFFQKIDRGWGLISDNLSGNNNCEEGSQDDSEHSFYAGEDSVVPDGVNVTVSYCGEGY